MISYTNYVYNILGIFILPTLVILSSIHKFMAWRLGVRAREIMKGYKTREPVLNYSEDNVLKSQHDIGFAQYNRLQSYYMPRCLLSD